MRNSIQPHRIRDFSLTQKIEDIYRVLRDSGQGNVNVVTYDSLDTLQNASPINGALANTTGYYEPGDGGGGEFYYDSISVEADNGGTIIKPASVSGAGRWKRILYGRNINVLWFGAKADGTTDNLEIFTNAIAALPNIPIPAYPTGYNMKGQIYVPGASEFYFFSDTLVIQDTIELVGDEGWDNLHATVLKFPEDTLGIFVPAAGVGGERGAHHVTFRNLMIKGGLGNDVSKHGLLLNRTCFGYNIDIESFAGSGLVIDSTISGLADLCYFERCSFYTNDVGIWTKGIDSNQCTFVHCNSFGNRRAGVFELSFLGNIYINLHTNANAEVLGNPVWAFHNDVSYAAIQDHTNIEPGVTSGWRDYWVVVDIGQTEPTTVRPAWSSIFPYKNGGAVYSKESATNASTFIGLYAEGGQPPIALASYNVVVGIGNGSGYRTKSAVIYGNEGMYCQGSINSAIAPTFGALPLQNVSMDENGFSLYPINQANGVRLTPTSLQFVSNPGIFAQIMQNSTAFSAFWILRSQMTNLDDFFARASMSDGMIHFPRGLFVGDEAEAGQGGRYLGMVTTVPTTGLHAKGDFVFKIIAAGGDTTLGWRCIASGTPGTWETINITTS